MANNTSMNPAHRITTILNHNEESFKYLTNSYREDIGNINTKLDSMTNNFVEKDKLESIKNEMENDMSKLNDKLDKEIEERNRITNKTDLELEKLIKAQNTMKVIFIVDTIILGLCILGVVIFNIIG